MIRPVMTYEAVCDCGCGRSIFLGKDLERARILMDLHGWQTEGKKRLSGFCKLPKVKKQRKAKP